MKKSLTYFLIGNLVLISIPIILTLRLNQKIGEVQAPQKNIKKYEIKEPFQEETMFYNLPLDSFSHIKIDYFDESTKGNLAKIFLSDSSFIRIKKDHLNKISYEIKNDTLKIQINEFLDKNFSVYYQKEISSLTLNNTNANVSVQNTDLNLFATNSNAHLILQSSSEVVSDTINDDYYLQYSYFGYKINLQLYDGSDISFASDYYIKEINFDIKNSTITNSYEILPYKMRSLSVKYDSLNLSIDSTSKFLFDIKDLESNRVNITYL